MSESTSNPATIRTLDAAKLTAGLLTVSQACRMYPGNRGNDTLAPSTMTRWIVKGCPSRNGQRVRLKATRCGSRWLIAPDDLAAFFGALADTVGPPAPQPKSASSKPSAVLADKAVQELARRGA
ncbi:hypothetical protein GobsT_49810 [Gemmata obscuriglobus]|uniref:DNA-binding protein n=1 Tax=Gemmata obscuriglobus TaxID=114 RepID=A0A2Z3H7U5_9BACT|nr:helix-turn-helix domain-containing protein [Gemmata obscuriglobus]AWM37100.1 DNA-binding protein [Gemmata obscuriglobus]QEG30178.1 hypothetical protein GobsT_49810 [Gemmata obscuriglobus]VTS09502.1 unnamed protein product [Gemmata obscuriglobus UQM 2246]